MPRAFLVIVRRDASALNERLRREFGHHGLILILDRRHAERRQSTGAATPDRRRRERREPALPWNSMGFVVRRRTEWGA